MTALSANRVLVLGRLPAVLQSVVKQLSARGVSARGSTDAEHAADEFDATDFDLIAFGSAIVGPLNERLRRDFARQNSQVQFLDAFAPVAVRQILSMLEGGEQRRQYVDGFRVDEEGADYLLTANILRPCLVRIEIHRAFGTPPPPVELLEESHVGVGPFQRRIEARYRIHGHMLLMMLNDSEYCLHRIRTVTTEPAAANDG